MDVSEARELKMHPEGQRDYEKNFTVEDSLRKMWKRFSNRPQQWLELITNLNRLLVDKVEFAVTKNMSQLNMDWAPSV